MRLKRPSVRYLLHPLVPFNEIYIFRASESLGESLKELLSSIFSAFEAAPTKVSFISVEPSTSVLVQRILLLLGWLKLLLL